MYYSTSFNAFCFVEKDPIPASSAIPLNEIEVAKGIRIKLRPMDDVAKTASNVVKDRGDPKRSKGKDHFDSLIHPQQYGNILSGMNAEEDYAYRQPLEIHNTKSIKERERMKDKEMILNLKKTLPNTDSQNQREIDVITKPSTRA